MKYIKKHQKGKHLTELLMGRAEMVAHKNPVLLSLNQKRIQT